MSAGKGSEIRKGHNYKAFWNGYDKIDFSKKELEYPFKEDIIEENGPNRDTRQQSVDGRRHSLYKHLSTDC